jgi:hypothetical protein
MIDGSGRIGNPAVASAVGCFAGFTERGRVADQPQRCSRRFAPAALCESSPLPWPPDLYFVERTLKTHGAMMANNPQPDPAPVSRRCARLRLIGIAALLAGMIGAGMVYWTHSPDLNDDLAMVGFDRAQRRQMGQLYGKMGTFIEDWSDDLEQPGTQAVLILGFSTIVAGGCFYFARLLGNDDQAG